VDDRIVMIHSFSRLDGRMSENHRRPLRALPIGVHRRNSHESGHSEQGLQRSASVGSKDARGLPLSGQRLWLVEVDIMTEKCRNSRTMPARFDSRIVLASAAVVFGCACSSPDVGAEQQEESTSALGDAVDARDFFYQSVCASPSGAVAAADPAACPAGTTMRKMRMIDPITFVNTTKNPGGRRYSAYPVQDTGGRTRYAWVRDATSRQVNARFDHDEPQTVEGFNIAEADGAFLASILSRDPSGYERYFSDGCANEDGWVYFAAKLPRTGSTIHAGRGASVRNGTGCPSSYGDGWSEATFVAKRRFASGKRLDAVVSRHGPGKFEHRDYFEMSVFTEEYGPTTWGGYHVKAANERPDMAKMAECALLPEIEDNGKKFVLQNCGDTSFVEVLPEGEWRSTFSWPLPQYADHGSKNVLPNPDFANGTAEGVRADWTVSPSAGQTVTVDSDATDNKFLKVHCTGACRPELTVATGAHPIANGADKLQYGARVWGDAATPARLEVTAIDANSRSRVIAGVDVILSPGPQLVTARTDPPRAGSTVRLSLRLTGSATSTVALDDGFIAATK